MRLRTHDPDELLEHLKQEEVQKQKGHLKVYLGYAAGVGKTYSMLQAARRLRDSGVDVVVGYLETHGREETEALMEGLEILPRPFSQGRYRLWSDGELSSSRPRSLQLRRPKVWDSHA